MRIGRTLLLVGILLTSAFTTLAFANIWGRGLALIGRTGDASITNTGSHAVSERTVQPPRLRRGLLPGRLRENLRVIGDRAEHHGKARLHITGTLRRGSDAQAKQVSLMVEARRRLRLRELAGGDERLTTYDRGAAAGGTYSDFEEDVIETLLHDMPDGLFAAQAEAVPTRFLGPRVALEGVAGAYDVYEVQDEVGVGQQARRRVKVFCFNSDTLLLERVRYRSWEDDVETPTEILLEDWYRSEGQYVPRRIVRLESDRPVFELTVQTVGFGPRAND
jgi:hypothetical protein